MAEFDYSEAISEARAKYDEYFTASKHAGATPAAGEAA